MFYSSSRMGRCDRVVVWFSAGAASAVAAKLTLKKYEGRLPVHICYCDTGSEHPDNERFISDRTAPVLTSSRMAGLLVTGLLTTGLRTNTGFLFSIAPIIHGAGQVGSRGGTRTLKAERR